MCTAECMKSDHTDTFNMYSNFTAKKIWYSRKQFNSPNNNLMLLGSYCFMQKKFQEYNIEIINMVLGYK